MASENQLVERITLALGPARGRARASGIRLGMGDDAAIISEPNGKEWVVSCDAFLENIHFLGDVHSPDSIGYKALVRAASDLAAMGASPAYFLLALALPGDRTGSWLNRFLQGMKRATLDLGISLIGGDTSEYSTISISITVIGEIARGLALKRSGASPGDRIYVSGRLGRAELGLRILQRGVSHLPSVRSLLRPHLYPKARLRLGAWLAEHRVPSAMMDLSDGLSTDLHRLCDASGVGARLWLDQIPRVKIPAGVSRRLGKRAADPMEMALHGGEDYELLFTVPRHHEKRLRGALEFRDVAAIGEITRERRILTVDTKGHSRVLAPGGWDSFSAKP